jgi:hypothetical protein
MSQCWRSSIGGEHQRPRRIPRCVCQTWRHFAGAYALEQVDAMRRVARQKNRLAKDRLTELDALLLKIAREAETRAERAKLLGKSAPGERE